jgi:hypothetical protein
MKNNEYRGWHVLREATDYLFKRFNPAGGSAYDDHVMRVHF